MEFNKENSLIANIPDFIPIESKNDQSECSCELVSISFEIEYSTKLTTFKYSYPTF